MSTDHDPFMPDIRHISFVSPKGDESVIFPT
jgi:hypothetical protein